MKIKIYQKSDKKHKDSFWYDGDIALLTEGDREVLVIANGDIRIHRRIKEGYAELVHDGWKERNSGVEGGLNEDKDLKKIGANYDDEYYWENNNWFECLFTLKGDSSWQDILGDVRFDYDRAIQMGKDILTSKDYESVWEE